MSDHSCGECAEWNLRVTYTVKDRSVRIGKCRPRQTECVDVTPACEHFKPRKEEGRCR